MVSLRISSSEIEATDCSWIPTNRRVVDDGGEMMKGATLERCWESADLEIWGVNAHADEVTQKARKVERKSFMIDDCIV